jgi:hypothetical protein
MIRSLRGWAARASLALAVVAAGGCAGTGWDDVLYGDDRYGYGSDIRGQVRDVGSRSLELRTEGGRHVRVYHDRYTEVRYGDRRYSVRSLDRGDEVVVRTRRERDGDLYARAVIVRRSGRDRVYDRRTDRYPDRRVPPRRDDAYARTSLEGRVGRVDRRNDRFELRGTRQGTVWVSVPRDASRGTRERIDRLREGQHVRLQGRFLSGNRFEVEGFR